MRVQGAYGEFEGDAEDRVVLVGYRERGAWSPNLVSLIADRLFENAGGTFIDVGAHIGLITVPVLERTRARCIAFEPEPRNREYLARNLRLHALEARVEVHQLALDARTGRAELMLSRDNSGDHRLLRDASACGDRESILVETARLDDLLAGVELERPIVMKLDTQGAEARVLRGAGQSLERVDYLVVEYWPAGLLRMGDHAKELQRLLLTFPHCALLEYQPLEGVLRSPAELFAQLAFIPVDGSDEGFFDILFSRHERLPAG